MERTFIFAVSAIIFCFFAVFKNAEAQEVFAAKDGFETARKAADEAGFKSAYCVNIRTVFTAAPNTEYADTKSWNGLSGLWEYTFYNARENSYHAFQVKKNTTLQATSISAERHPNTGPIETEWLNSTIAASLAREEARIDSGAVIELFFAQENPSTPGKTIWHARSVFSSVALDAITGENVTRDVMSDHTGRRYLYAAAVEEVIAVPTNYCGQNEVMRILTNRNGW